MTMAERMRKIVNETPDRFRVRPVKKVLLVFLAHELVVIIDSATSQIALNMSN